jgi:hypothetical protein
VRNWQCLDTYIYTHTYIHTYTHTYIHTYIHTRTAHTHTPTCRGCPLGEELAVLTHRGGERAPAEPTGVCVCVCGVCVVFVWCLCVVCVCVWCVLDLPHYTTTPISHTYAIPPYPHTCPRTPPQARTHPLSTVCIYCVCMYVCIYVSNPLLSLSLTCPRTPPQYTHIYIYTHTHTHTSHLPTYSSAGPYTSDTSKLVKPLSAAERCICHMSYVICV